MKLQTKLALAILPLILGSILVLGYWANRTAENALVDSLFQKMVMALEQDVTQRLSIAVEVLKKHDLDRLPSYVSRYQQDALRSLDAALGDSDYQTVIFDRSKNLVYLNHSRLLPEKQIPPLLQYFQDRFPQDGHRHLQGNIHLGQTGVLYVAHSFEDWDWIIFLLDSDQKMHDAVSQIHLATLSLALFCAAASLALLLAMLKRFYVNPILKLKQAAAGYARGEWEHQTGVRSRDELGKLARSLESMARDLRGAEQQRDLHLKESEEKNGSLKREIRNRTEAEALLRRQALALEQMSEGVITTDLEGRILDWNRGAEQIFGYGRQEALGRPVHMLHCPAVKQRLLQRVIGAVMEQDRWSGESCFVRKDGTRGIRESIVETVRNAQGERIALVSLSRDVTEKKATELALEKAHSELEKTVSARTAQLRTSNALLQEEIRERKQIQEQLLGYQRDLRLLASELSLVAEKERRALATQLHDGLGQNLALLKIQLDLYKTRIPPEQRDGTFDELIQSVKSAIRYTRDLTHQMSPPMLLSLDFSATLEWLGDQILVKNGVRFKFHAPAFALAFTDNQKILLSMIVRELMVNIVKHAGATLAEMRFEKYSGMISLRLEDNGRGFSPDAVQQRRRGEGLGLFSIRERIEHIGGKVRLAAGVGKGCSILLSIPAEAMPLPRQAREGARDSREPQSGPP